MYQPLFTLTPLNSIDSTELNENGVEALYAFIRCANIRRPLEGLNEFISLLTEYVLYSKCYTTHLSNDFVFKIYGVNHIC